MLYIILRFTARLIKSGGGIGPVKPGNLHMQGANSVEMRSVNKIECCENTSLPGYPSGGFIYSLYILPIPYNYVINKNGIYKKGISK